MAYFWRSRFCRSVSECLMNVLEVRGSLTHGSREDDDPQDVHTLAGTRDDFVLDVWSWGDLQEDRVAQLRVVVVGHDVHVVGLRLLDVGTLHDGNQVGAVLRGNHREATVGPGIGEHCPKTHCCLKRAGTHLLKCCFN